MIPAGLILALSVFCDAQTVAQGYRGPGNLVTVIAVVWFLGGLLIAGLALAIGGMLFTIQQVDRPFARPVHVSPEPFQKILESFQN